MLKEHGIKHMKMVVEEGLQHQMSLGGIAHLKNFLGALMDPNWESENKKAAEEGNKDSECPFVRGQVKKARFKMGEA